MKKFVLVLLCVPLFLLFGLGHGLIVSRLVKDREPWLTLGMLVGLTATVALLAWAMNIPASWAMWTCAGAAVLYLLMRLMFGKGSSLEMLVPAHVMALLALLAWPAFAQARKKAARVGMAVSPASMRMQSASFDHH